MVSSFCCTAAALSGARGIQSAAGSARYQPPAIRMPQQAEDHEAGAGRLGHAGAS